MKRLMLCILFALMSGCDNSADRAPANMQKGDEYLASKDYEIAQYYYEKIPEESPLYKEAQTKLQQIDEAEQSLLPKGPGPEEAQKVTIFETSITSNPGGILPIHSVELNNESTFRVKSVVLEFTYFDAAGNVVGVKQRKVPASMAGQTQDTFTGITPGSLDAPCVSCKVRIVSVQFK
ncbi:MAG TPA: hypothetical protein VMM58_07950 [Bacteroidota bacterium]|nr:hypothetical protein [Bacteroidota bacterium]